MSWRYGLWTFLAAAHLALALCGAAGWLAGKGRESIPPPLLWHAAMSGADYQYSFYAPEVGSNYRARFTLRDSRGRSWEASFEDSGSPEARLRLSGITAAGFANSVAVELPERRLRLVKSWAATMFSRHPTAESLTMVVEVFEIPTMAEYRDGRRPRWAAVYQAPVRRSPATPRNGVDP